MNDPFAGNGPGFEAPSPALGSDGPSLDSGEFSPRENSAATPPPSPAGKTPPPLGLVALACSVAAILLSLFTLWTSPGQAPPSSQPQPVKQAVSPPPSNAAIASINVRLGVLEQQVKIMAKTSGSAATMAEMAQLKRQLQQVQANLGELASKRPAPAEPARQQTKQATKAQAPKSAAKPAVAKTIVHTVNRGQTLMGIARKYGVSVNDIKKWNKIKGESIMVGQRLTINKAR